VAFKLEDLKLTAPTPPDASAPVEVIVKVRKAGYVPKGVTVRARVDDFIFTADTTADILDKLRGNRLVVSVAQNQKLRIG